MAQDKPNWTASLGHDGTSPTAEDLRRHWDMPRALSIFSNAQRVGRLSERAGIWELQYDHTWMTSPEGWDLGPGLPRAAGTITDGASERPVQWFFDNLLPEEDMRTAVAKTASVDQADAFALLGYLGRESAGSLVASVSLVAASARAVQAQKRAHGVQQGGFPRSVGASNGNDGSVQRQSQALTVVPMQQFKR